MKISKYTMRSCCGKTTVAFTVDKSIDDDFSAKLASIGFVEADHFKKSGILYTQNEDFILTGPYGSNRVQVKCRKKDCDQKINELEQKLKNME